MSLISFCNLEATETYLAPRNGIGEALASEGAEVTKPHLSTVEVHILTSTAGGLRYAGSVCITFRTIFSPHPLPWSFWETIEERNFSARTAIQTFAKCNSLWYRKVIEMK